MASGLKRKYLLNFGVPLINIENVYWHSSEKNWENEDLKREQTLTQFPGKINMQVNYLMQYIHTYSLVNCSDAKESSN